MRKAIEGDDDHDDECGKTRGNLLIGLVIVVVLDLLVTKAIEGDDDHEHDWLVHETSAGRRAISVRRFGRP